jgi:hypothetical protein
LALTESDSEVPVIEQPARWVADSMSNVKHERSLKIRRALMYVEILFLTGGLCLAGAALIT